jgi:putative Mg2+ transporter-C (MgtC) family protein
MIVAAVLGGLIGIEREWSNHAAGFRTHILVCLGSASIMLLSIYGFGEFVNETNVRVDPSRLAAQVVNGIGFLGAGAILRSGHTIKGLTTAASVWVVAAIGLSVGAGFFAGAFICTLLVLISLYVLNKWEKMLMKKRKVHDLVLHIADAPGALEAVVSAFAEHGIRIASLKMNADGGDDADGGQAATKVHASLVAPGDGKWMQALGQLAAMSVVVSVEAQGSSVTGAAGAKEKAVSF